MITKLNIINVIHLKIQTSGFRKFMHKIHFSNFLVKVKIFIDFWIEQLSKFSQQSFKPDDLWDYLLLVWYFLSKII